VLTAWREPGRTASSTRSARIFERCGPRERSRSTTRRAATHLFALSLAELNQRRLDGPAKLARAEADASVVAGVRVFLRGYAPPR
jgi:hypothetical protein